MNTSTVFVFGHQTPDTDSCASAVVAAALKQQLDPARRYQALRLGEVNSQTRWLFEQARLPLPPFRRDLRPFVSERMQREVVTVSPQSHLGDALQLLRHAPHGLVPVVDADHKLLGILSDRLPQNQYFFYFNVEDFLGELLGLADVVAALRLRPLNEVPVPAGPAGSFRLARSASSLQPGDVLISSPDLLPKTLPATLQGVLLADSDEASARTQAAGLKCPAYWYDGSLLALVSELPKAITVGHVMSRDPVTLSPDQFVHDVAEITVHSLYSLPVIEGDRRLVGLLSRTDMLDPHKRPVIIVDHFESAQTAAGLETAEVLEIIDHHRVGDLQTIAPARVDCRPIGSTASILACQFRENGLTPTSAEALLLLGALFSDTLLLTSPTTTAIDRDLAEWLTGLAGVDAQAFGRELLKQNDELATGEPTRLVARDMKEFTAENLHFAVAQIETVDLNLLTPERRQALQQALGEERAKRGVAFAALLVTDVFQSNSFWLLSDPVARRAKHLLGGADPETGASLPGVVSRKKQFLPLLLERLRTAKP